MIECRPLASVEAARLAAPAALSGALPRAVEPSEKTTVPSGRTLPPPGGTVTLAVKVTGAPTLDGFRLDARATIVPSSTV